MRVAHIKKNKYLNKNIICLFLFAICTLSILIPVVSYANSLEKEQISEDIKDKHNFSTTDNPVLNSSETGTHNGEGNYLCLKPSKPGQSASFKIQRYLEPTGKDFNYSYDKITWEPVFNTDYSTIQETEFSIDKPIYFKGNNPNGLSRENSYYKFIINQQDMDASGSVMSLLDNGIGTMTKIPNTYCFFRLFGSLTPYDECSKLMTAPELPATTLKENCYALMFARCTSLKDAPYLPAENLVYDCYHSMFQDCESLCFVDAAFNDWNTSSPGTTSWLTGVKNESSCIFVCSSQLDITKKGGNYIPTKWTVYNEKKAVATVANYTNQYDGNEHGVTVSDVYPKDATVLYSTDDVNYSTTPVTGKDVGTTVVYVKVSRNGFIEFKTVGTINITPNTGATATITDNEKDYGQKDPTFEVKFTGIGGGTPVLGTDYILEREKGEDVKDNGGTYTVKLYWIRDNNYKLNNATGSLKINKAKDLKLVANPASKVEGSQDPTLTAHMEGLKFDDSFDPEDYNYYHIDQVTDENGNITLKPILEDAGMSLYGQNYYLENESYVKTSTLTVYAAAEQSFTYTTNAFNINYNGQLNEFKVNVNNPPAGITIEYKTSPEGTYDTTTPKFKDADTYTVYFKISAAGYSTVETSQQVKINPAPATLVADYSCIYKNVGDPDPELNATLFGAVNGESLVKGTDYNISRIAGEDAGSYDLSLSAVSGTDKTKNYQIQVAPSKFFILGSGDVPPVPPTPPTPDDPGTNPSFVNSIIAQTGDDNLPIVIALIVVVCACGGFIAYRKIRKK